MVTSDPDGETATPNAAFNKAAVPTPSAHDAVGLPATVVTTAAGEMLRSMLLSATMRLPPASMATSTGYENRANVPTASKYALVIVGNPANVVTSPASVILRMRL